MQKIKYTHGIIYNDKDKKIEAWNNGRMIGRVSYGCTEQTKKIWLERYKKYLSDDTV